MKRNTLMKRLAVVALAATMSVGMAVPAMAANGVVTGNKNASNHVVTSYIPQHLAAADAASYAQWLTLDKWTDTAELNLNSSASDTTADFHINSDGKVCFWKIDGHHYTKTNKAVSAYTWFNKAVTPNSAGETDVTNTDDINKLDTTSYTQWLLDEGYIRVPNDATKKAAGLYIVTNKNGAKDWTGKNADADYVPTKDSLADAMIRLGYLNEVDDYGWVEDDSADEIYTFTNLNGSAEDTYGTRKDNGTNVVWTVKALNTEYFDAKLDGRTLKLTPNKFGTTIYEYTGKLYHGSTYIGKNDVVGYFAISMPLNDETIGELVDEGIKNVVATNGVNSATADATKAVQDAINAKDPKVWEFDTKDNNTHKVTATVDTINGYHANEGFTGHVVVKNYDENGNLVKDSYNGSYDYGIKNFTFAKAAVNFTDVADTAYYYAPVYWGVKNGLVKGTSDTTFSPYNNLTREQLIVMLYRQAGSPAVTINEKFDDLAGLSDESKKAISWGVQNGIVNGTSDVKFSPKENVTRAQVVTMLYRLDGDKKAYNETNFTDVAHGSYYENAVDWAVNQKIVNGTSLTTFSPKADTTRAQGITLLYRYFNR